MELNLDKLKISCGSIISGRESITNEQKIFLLDKIQEETDLHEFISILLDGERKENLNKIDKLTLEGRFIASEHYSMVNEGPVGSIVGMLIFNPILWAAWRGAAAIVSKGRRKCGTFRISSQRDMCLERFKILSIKKKIEVMNKAITECPKAKDPKKCKEKGDYGVEKLEKKLKTKEEKYKMKWGEMNK